MINSDHLMNRVKNQKNSTATAKMKWTSASLSLAGRNEHSFAFTVQQTGMRSFIHRLLLQNGIFLSPICVCIYMYVLRCLYLLMDAGSIEVNNAAGQSRINASRRFVCFLFRLAWLMALWPRVET